MTEGGVVAEKRSVLVVSSSPRGDGNSNLLCHEFAAAVRGVVWGERVWQRGEVRGMPAMDAERRLGQEAARRQARATARERGAMS